MKFSVFGHPNILGTHVNTLEFSKDSEVSMRGNCIIGLKATFDYNELVNWLKGKEKITVKMKVDGIVDELTCFVNSDFCSDHEIVIRKTDFLSDRTLGIRAGKGSMQLSREMMEKMRSSEAEMEVEFLTTN